MDGSCNEKEKGEGGAKKARKEEEREGACVRVQGEIIIMLRDVTDPLMRADHSVTFKLCITSVCRALLSTVFSISSHSVLIGIDKPLSSLD